MAVMEMKMLQLASDDMMRFCQESPILSNTKVLPNVFLKTELEVDHMTSELFLCTNQERSLGSSIILC